MIPTQERTTYNSESKPQIHKTFAQELIEFYGLESRPETSIYFAGLNISPSCGSYEQELDELVRDVNSELDSPSKLKKIGVTLSPQIAEQRSDIETVVGDLYEMHFDGILFLPRPLAWFTKSCAENYSSGTYSDNELNSFLASLMRQTELGLIAFNLEIDYDDNKIDYMHEFLDTKLDYTAEIVHSPERRSKKHILVKR